MRTMTRVASGIAIAPLLVAGLSCGIKTHDFFSPTPLTQAPVTDVTPPIFSGFLPMYGGTGPYHINKLSFDLNDPQGTNGATPSGVDPTTLAGTFTGAGTPLTFTSIGSRYTAPLTGYTDGAYTLNLSAKDKKGNLGTALWTYTLDNTGPVITFTNPPVGGTSNAVFVPFTLTGTVQDPNFFVAVVGIYRVGSDNTCATSTTLWPKGTAPGQVSENLFDISSSIRQNGTYSVSYNANNGVLAGGTPVTAHYCKVVHAEDNARDENGALSPNVTMKFLDIFETWNPMAATTGNVIGRVTTSGGNVAGATISAGGLTSTTATDGTYRINGLTPGSATVAVSNLPNGITCTPSTKTTTIVAGVDVTVDFSCTLPAITITWTAAGKWMHGSGTSTVCQAAAAAGAAIANAAYQATLSGPGVVGSGQFSGNLSPTGTVTLTGTINLFGSYTWTLTVGGTSSTSPPTVVTAAAGAGCP